MILIAIAMLAAPCDSWSTEKPRELLAVESSRASIVNADIFWSRRTPQRELPFQRFRTRIAGDEIVFEEFGDEQGARSFKLVDGKPRRMIYQPPERTLYSNREKWIYREDEATASAGMYEGAPDVPELRGLGLTPSLPTQTPWAEFLHQRGGGTNAGAEYCSTTQEDGTITIRMRPAAQPSHVTTWTLGPSVGYQPVRCELREDGQLIRACTVTYSEVGPGEFFVKTAEYRTSQGIVYARFEVSKASINAGELPVSLTPADIGIDNGVNIYYAEGHPKHGEIEIWCEGVPLSIDEYVARQSTVGVRPGKAITRLAPFMVDRYEETVKRNAEVATAASQPLGIPASQPAWVPGEWERYTREFISRYELDEDQSQKAMAILKQCQDRAWEIVERTKTKLTQIDQRLAALGSNSGEADKRADLEQARRRLLDPIDEIFEKQLKPKLAALPTRAQRAAVESTAQKEGKTP